MFILGLLIYVIGLFFVMFLKGLPWSVLNNPAAFFAIILPLVAVLTATRGFVAFKEGLKAAVFPQKTISKETRAQAMTLFRLLSKTAALASVIGAIVAVMSALTDINDTERLRHVISAACGTPLFGVSVIVCVFGPVAAALKKRGSNEKK